MSRFVYVTYIRTTAAKLWRALIDPEFTKQYWFGAWQECEWTQGASWKLMMPDGNLADSGEVLEIEPGKRFVVSWRHELNPEMSAEGYSRMTCEIDERGDTVRLSITHEMDGDGVQLIRGVSTGWPAILSSLKSLLETGQPLEEARQWLGKQE